MWSNFCLTRGMSTLSLGHLCEQQAEAAAVSLLQEPLTWRLYSILRPGLKVTEKGLQATLAEELNPSNKTKHLTSGSHSNFHSLEVPGM